MRLDWVIDATDVAKVKAFVASRKADPFVRNRRTRNLGPRRPHITRRKAWMTMIGCLLTTQQRSGPGQPVKRFLDSSPFPLPYERCRGPLKGETFILKTLSQFGGIRRSTTIAGQAASNLRLLEDGHWETLLSESRRVDAAKDAAVERSVARYIAETFHGFGPKQSRNFLQWLGVSRYEIPIDSRITKWLNDELLTFRLNAALLADAEYYDMVSDGIIKLSRMAGVFPCVLDAAVFSSFDKAGWTAEDLGADSF